jgi:hypothetical protein
LGLVRASSTVPSTSTVPSFITVTAPQVLLSLENVDTFYGKSHILSGVTFDVHAHEIVAEPI